MKSKGILLIAVGAYLILSPFLVSANIEKPSSLLDFPALDEKYEIENRLPNESELLVRYGKPQSRSLEKGESLRVLVWNIYKNNRSTLEEDLRHLSEVSDLSLLQETITNSHMKNYYSGIGGYDWLTAVSFIQRNEVGTGVKTGSRFRLADILPLRSPGREPVAGTPKMSLVTEVQINGRSESLLVANIHALNFVTNSRFRSQIDQVEEALSQHSGPIIFAGDFNTHNNGRRRILVQMMERLDLTWVDLDGDNRRLALDHVFVRGFEVKKARLLNEIRSSDHKPIVVDLKLL